MVEEAGAEISRTLSLLRLKWESASVEKFQQGGYQTGLQVDKPAKSEEKLQHSTISAFSGI